MDLWFLGTGAGLPSKQRNVSSIALSLAPRNPHVWLFDCGEGTQQRFLDIPVKLSHVNRIYLTHLHGDHVYGLPGLLGTRSFHGATEPLTVYGPAGTSEFVTTNLHVTHAHLTYPLDIVEVSDGWSCVEEGYAVRAALLDHVVPSFGYRVTEPPYPGRLNVERLQAEGLQPGPHYGALKRGETVTIQEQSWEGAKYVDPPTPGLSVAILGDTRPSPASVRFSQGADVLVHEATFLDDLREQANLFGHSTALQAAQIARAAGVTNLILTHISQRYAVQDTGRLLEEAQTLFPNTTVAKDNDCFSLSKSSGSKPLNPQLTE